MIIDKGSCTIVASTSLVGQLNLTTLKHFSLYKLQQLNDCVKVKVKQTSACFVLNLEE